MTILALTKATNNQILLLQFQLSVEATATPPMAFSLGMVPTKYSKHSFGHLRFPEFAFVRDGLFRQFLFYF